MAKHPHKIMLIDNRTWRCVLDGCAFFVHLGLAHVIIGKRLICWTCEDTFIMAKEPSTREPMPKCDTCKGGVIAPWDIDAHIEEMKKRNQQSTEKDEVEVIDECEQHSPDCEVHEGGDCTCQ